jgi:hypothetical protein
MQFLAANVNVAVVNAVVFVAVINAVVFVAVINGVVFVAVINAVVYVAVVFCRECCSRAGSVELPTLLSIWSRLAAVLVRLSLFSLLDDDDDVVALAQTTTIDCLM